MKKETKKMAVQGKMKAIHLMAATKMEIKIEQSEQGSPQDGWMTFTQIDLEIKGRCGVSSNKLFAYDLACKAESVKRNL